MKRTISFMLAFLLICSMVPLQFLSVSATAAGVPAGMVYSVENGEVTITDYTGSDSRVEIPSVIDGYPVTTIGENAFSSCSELTAITIPSSIKRVGYRAFSDCKVLTEVHITDLASWCHISFDYFETPYTIFAIGTNPLHQAKHLYLNGTLVEDLVIPGTVNEVKDFLFWGCSSIKTVTLSKGVKQVGECTFCGCTSLTDIFFGPDIVHIGYHAISNTPSLQRVEFTGAYPKFDRYNYHSSDPDCLPEIELAEDCQECCDRIACLDTGTADGYYPGNDQSWLVHEQHDFRDTIEDPINWMPAPPPSDLEYRIENNGVIITGYTGSDSRVEIPGMIDGYPVTGIDSFSFAYCTSLVSVTVPASVTYMGKQVFQECPNLLEVWLYCAADAVLWYDPDPDTLPEICICDEYFCNICNPQDGTFGYINMYRRPKVYISADYAWTINRISGDISLYYFGATEDGLEYHAYSGGVSIVKYTGNASHIKIPATILGQNVCTIQNHAFANHTELSLIMFQGDAPSFGENAFQNVVATVTYFSDRNYWTEAKLQNYGGKLTWERYDPIPENLQYTIANGKVTITGYTGSATAVSIPNMIDGYPVTAIAKEAFMNCTALKQVLLPDNLVTIGDCAFSGCTGLISVNIPEKVVRIGESAFESCTALAEIVISDSVTRIDQNAFYGCIGLKKAVIGNGVTNMGTAVFSACHNLQEVTIGSGLGYISDYAFSQCNTLRSITIPEGVTSIGDCSFSLCSKLQRISLPNSLTYIGDKAFDLCKDLEYITFHGVKSQWDDIDFTPATDCQITLMLPNPGDFTGDQEITNEDVEYLLWQTLFPEQNILYGNVDYIDDGYINNKDVEFLLWHSLFPEEYPL